jgi:hypothetical protein
MSARMLGELDGAVYNAVLGPEGSRGRGLVVRDSTFGMRAEELSRPGFPKISTADVRRSMVERGRQPIALPPALAARSDVRVVRWSDLPFGQRRDLYEAWRLYG